jgi:insulysin
MNAVESEYKKNLSEDSRRLFQIEKSEIVRKGSILNRFSTGGLETLKIPSIREDLLAFHEKHYSSNIMNLVIVGRHSLEDLEKLAIDNFSEVANKNVILPDFSKEVVYDDQSMGHVFKIVPNKNIKRLKILWNLPSSKLLYKEKPMSFISHLIGHEGPNSLLSQLIKEGLATALSSSDSDRL